MALASVSCYYMTSLNYGGKKTSDVGLTCKCHLGIIMPDSIFFDNMGFCMGHNHGFSRDKRDGFNCLIIITPVDLRKP